MWQEYVNAISVNDVIKILSKYGQKARVVAGATDLMLELERGVRKDIHTLVDITRIPGLNQLFQDKDGVIHMGPMVTHNLCAASKLLQDYAFPLSKASFEVGSPQIRNRGTIAGNLLTASPANDTITPLMALGAKIVFQSTRGERSVDLKDLYIGVRKTIQEPDEMLVDIQFPAMKSTQRGVFIKHALRQAQAISLVNMAIVLDFNGEIIQNAAITLGAVAPTIIHANEAERFLTGKKLNPETIKKASELAMEAAKPISDVRSSAAYRKTIVRVITKRGLQMINDQSEKYGFPDDPVLLGGNEVESGRITDKSYYHDLNSPIETTINGKRHIFRNGQNKSLLRLLREDAQLTGSKEGCSEGECGACTVFLDGAAVMSCMVPAPRAHLAEVQTIEGLVKNGVLHPVQSAFIEEGAVQCGYCTPGFIMSAAKLLEERPSPSQDEIKQAITGNLCRCTGYYKIIKAIERAAK